MGKVVQMFPPTDDPVQFLMQLLQSAENPGGDSMESVVFAAKLKSGNWYLGYCNAGFALRMEAMSQVNCDVIDLMIRNNADRYGLHDHE